MIRKLNSPLVHKAMVVAAIGHQKQWRRHPKLRIPYISHPACVGIILAKAGYGDEVVAAGILHDVVEDCGMTLKRLARDFTPHIARWVGQVSEPADLHTWAERKTAYCRQLQSADKEALAVAAADHLHNMDSLREDYLVDRKALGMFHVGIDKKLENERLCASILQQRLPGPLSREFAATLRALDELIGS